MGDDQGGARGDLLDQGRRDVEAGDQGGALGGDRDHVLVLVPEARADAVGVAQREGGTVADHPDHEIAAVPGARGLAQHAAEVELVGEARGERGPAEVVADIAQDWASLATSRKWPIFSITVEVSAEPMGCWPMPTSMSKISSVLVRLKLPARLR